MQTNLFIQKPNFNYHVPDEQIQFVALCGSHSYGWSTDKSDIDLRVVYLPSFNEVINPFQTVKINQYMELPYDITTIPLSHFLGLLVKGNANYLENLYMTKIKTNHVELQLKNIIGRYLHHGFLSHYLGYYQSLKHDLNNATRLEKYGYEKLAMNSYRVLMTGIILHEKRKVVYNLKDLDMYFPETNALIVLEEYLKGNTIMEPDKKYIDQDLSFLEDLLKSFVDEKDKKLPVRPPELEEELLDSYSYWVRSQRLRHDHTPYI